MQNKTLFSFAVFCLFLTVFLGMASAQVQVAPFLTSRVQFSNASGAAPCNGCLLDTFAAGTTNTLATYSESTGTTPNSNPITLASDGSAVVYLTNASYKFRLRTAAGVTIWTQDNVTWNNLATTLSSLTLTGNATINSSTAATNVANQSGPTFCMDGNFWNGAASAVDSWCWNDVLGTGTNPTSTLTLVHSGSSGTPVFSVPALSASSVSVSGAVTLAGPKPWIDPTHSTYGAKCDGVTDDTTAIRAALAVTVANGGSLVIPDGLTCVIATSSSPALNLDEAVNTAIIGGVAGAGASRPGGGTTLSPRLLFTGTPAIAIGARGSTGVSLKRLVLQVNNASFTGNIVDTSHFPGDTRCSGGTACDSQDVSLENNTFIGVASTAELVNFDKTIISRITGNSFFLGVTQLAGAASSASYSIQVRVEDNNFNGSSGVTTMILNPGEAWKISANTFELNGIVNGSTIVGCTAAFLLSKGDSFVNNWIGDLVGTPTITLVNVCGSGFDLSANQFSVTDANATAVTVANSVGNFHARANTICSATFGTAFALGTGDIVDIKEDTCSSTITNFLTGSPGSGSIVTDTTGLTTFYGPVTLGGTTTLSGSGNVIKNSTLTGASNGNAVTLLNTQGVTSPITGTGADATVYTFTIPANTLAQGKGIRVTTSWAHGTGTASVAYKLSFGASAVLNPSVATAGSYYMTAIIMNNPGSTNAQRISGLTTSAAAVVQSVAGNSAAEDTTGAVIVKLTFNVAATDQVTGGQFLVELIQ